jgi:hypothetical protein
VFILRIGMSTRETNQHTYCEQQAELLQTWHFTVSKFSAAVAKLRHAVGVSTKAEYERLRTEVEAKRLAADNARVNLDFHRLEHGC